MCGIAGIYNLKGQPIDALPEKMALMNKILDHRGPDGNGVWIHGQNHLGLGHTRLSIIDLSNSGSQPMISKEGNVITFNGEIYNYQDIKSSLKNSWQFVSSSDTESILASHSKFKLNALSKLRGMFSFGLWDEGTKKLFCARDRFGIKPFYYLIKDDCFYFSSEAKALLPFLNNIELDEDAFAEYLTFQYTIGEKTLFKGIKQLMPGHYIEIEKGKINIERYWDVKYEIDWNNDKDYFYETFYNLLKDSVKYHLKSDVEVGTYLSGGIDSSLLLNLASDLSDYKLKSFHGRFLDYPGYDESKYAVSASKLSSSELKIIDISADDFKSNIQKVIYHLDFPVAGPGSFPQFMTSKLAAKDVKVVFGGQGGDEIFGGYARYVISYLEQCLKAAIDGTYKDGNFVVTIESIIPNLGLLREYKPLMKEFWKEGLFDSMDKRYFRLVDRSNDMKNEVHWDLLNKDKVFSNFQNIFNNEENVGKEAYLDKMTHFDFKCLLPALLQVEDRMSMAHGLESRVPFLDHEVVEFAATVPANFKFEDGKMKHLIKEVFKDNLPKNLIERRDKMGFPVPLKEWFDNDLEDFSKDILSDMASKDRPFINSKYLKDNSKMNSKFSRKSWALISLELWFKEFFDNPSSSHNFTK